MVGRKGVGVGMGYGWYVHHLLASSVPSKIQFLMVFVRAPKTASVRNTSKMKRIKLENKKSVGHDCGSTMIANDPLFTFSVILLIKPP